MMLRHILIADDEAAVRDVLVELVRHFDPGEQYTVSTASDGSQVLKMMTRDRPDLVLLDHRMPGMTGLDVLRQIRETHPRVRVILISGAMEAGEVAEAMRNGVFSYVPKPLDPGYLQALIAVALPPS
jgi:two-component system, response regulator, stage 0 sporulation protein F